MDVINIPSKSCHSAIFQLEYHSLNMESCLKLDMTRWKDSYYEVRITWGIPQYVHLFF